MGKGDDAHSEFLGEILEIARGTSVELHDLAKNSSPSWSAADFLDEATLKVNHAILSAFWKLNGTGSSWDPKRWIMERMKNPDED